MNFSIKLKFLVLIELEIERVGIILKKARRLILSFSNFKARKIATVAYL